MSIPEPPAIEVVECSGMPQPDFDTTFAVSIPEGAWLRVRAPGGQVNHIGGPASISRAGYIYFPATDTFLSLAVWDAFFAQHPAKSDA